MPLQQRFGRALVRFVYFGKNDKKEKFEHKVKFIFNTAFTTAGLFKSK